MAYDFVTASSQYLSTASAPATTVPLTMACWFRTTSSATNQAIMQLHGETSVVASRTNRYLLAANIAAVNSPFRVFTQSTNGDSDALSDYNGLQANTTYHGAGVFSGTSSRTAYLNGVAATADTTLTRVQTVSQMTIGSRFVNNANGLYFTGWIAEVGIWNVALTAAEIASLAAGFACSKVRPQSLVFYAPLVRDLIDARGGLTITNNNTATVANHPRVYA